MLKKQLMVSLLCAVLMLGTLTANAMDFRAEDVYGSVFVIYAGNSLGSGFAVGENCVVTNAHVIGDAGKITVASYDEHEYSAYVIAADYVKDIAILGVEEASLEPIRIGSAEDCAVGDNVYAVGAPKSLFYSLTKGIISAKGRVIGDQSYLQIDAAINNGNSGGPLLTEDGKVIGMNTMTLEDSEGIGLAIPIDTVLELMKEENIGLNDEGNVKEPVVPPQKGTETASDGAEPHNPARKEEFPLPEGTTRGNILRGIIATVTATAVIAVIFVYQRNKNKPARQDPTERTDFTIDILE